MSLLLSLSSNLSSQALITLPKYFTKCILRNAHEWAMTKGTVIKQVWKLQHSMKLSSFLYYGSFFILSTLGISKKESTAFTLEGIHPLDFIKAVLDSAPVPHLASVGGGGIPLFRSLCLRFGMSRDL